MSRHLVCLFWALAAVPAGCGRPTHETWRNPKDGMVFVRVPPGVLRIEPAGGEASTAGPRVVAIEQGFWMGRTEVTVGQYRRFVRATGYQTEAEQAGAACTWKSPGFRQTDAHPVIYLSYPDVARYAEWAGVELPTDAEWLYASRAGSNTRYYWGEEVDKAAFWHRENSPAGTHPVGLRPANAWGLYDTIGNAYEWCRVEPADASEPTEAYPFGGSWTRCPDRVVHDLPQVPFQRYRVMPAEDDRGFRCVRRR